MSGKAYVYAIKVDGVVRYIGKGTGRRYAGHLAKVRQLDRRQADGLDATPPSRFYSLLLDAYRRGLKIEPVIVSDGLADRDAYRLEIETRKQYPAKQLWNERPCWQRPEYRARQLMFGATRAIGRLSGQASRAE